MEYQSHAATAAAIRRIKSSNLPTDHKLRNGALVRARNLDAFYIRKLPLQIFFQHNGGGKGINCHFAFRLGLSLWRMQILAGCHSNGRIHGSAALLFKQTLGFPTGETFIDHFDRHANLFADTLGKTRSFLSHFAVGAVEAQRKAYDNLRYTLRASEFAEAAHIFVAIDAFHVGKWLWEGRLGVGGGLTKSLLGGIP